MLACRLEQCWMNLLMTLRRELHSRLSIPLWWLTLFTCLFRYAPHISPLGPLASVSDRECVELLASPRSSRFYISVHVGELSHALNFIGVSSSDHPFYFIFLFFFAIFATFLLSSWKSFLSENSKTSSPWLTNVYLSWWQLQARLAVLLGCSSKSI